MITTNQLKLLQIEKTKLFLKKNKCIFFLHWTPLATNEIKTFKQKFHFNKKNKNNETISILKIKNTLFANTKEFTNLNLPKIEGPNLFIGCNTTESLNKIYNVLQKTPNILIIGARIDNNNYNHLELKVYFDQIFNKNVHLNLVNNLYSATAIHTKLGLLQSFQLLKYTLDQIHNK